ncbi:mitochondrial carrier domain-containing protein [Jimgerdemannia flammicorona]|uniref:Mitochondrial carrier domain-containing protein n=1 Tax=Jimgerdemannia flammicorona TaxID=994334 RepID=A0A433QUZ8_9FUNG|nr:mitochondrial carrier domain-containing protein [Jimgerdemannia flammicorona]
MTTKILEVASKDQTSQGRVHDTTSSFSNRARGFAAGVASGITKLVVGHPFDTIKVRLQTSGAADGRFAGPLDCFKSTLRQEGVRGLYKGATPPLVGWMFMDSIMLGTLHNTRMLLQQYNGPDRPLSIFQHGLAGLAGGLTVSFLATPVEQIKARLQVQYADGKKLYTGPIHCAKTLIHNNGFFRGLWKGLVPTMLFRSWFFVFWSSYEVYGRELRKRGYSDSAVSFIAGGVCANTFWLGGFPFDVVKNRIMTQPDVKPPRFPTMRSCAEFVYRTEGLKGFYRGFLPCFLRAFPTNASAILAFETVMKLLGDNHKVEAEPFED